MLKLTILSLFGVWILGMLTSHFFDGWIHVLPVVAVLLFILQSSNELPTQPGDTGPRMKKQMPKNARPRS